MSIHINLNELKSYRIVCSGVKLHTHTHIPSRDSPVCPPRTGCLQSITVQDDAGRLRFYTLSLPYVVPLASSPLLSN